MLMVLSEIMHDVMYVNTVVGDDYTNKPQKPLSTKMTFKTIIAFNSMSWLPSPVKCQYATVMLLLTA